MTIICGIDPGISGAIAFLDENGELRTVHDMPVIEVEVGGKKRNQISPYLLAGLFARGKPGHVFLEHVSSRPGEGAVGAFSFGRGFGQIEGVLAAMTIPCTLVRPAMWKKKLGVPADKGGARMFACRRFPGYSGEFARVKDDGRAEAALIGAYGCNEKKGTERVDK